MHLGSTSRDVVGAIRVGDSVDVCGGRSAGTRHPRDGVAHGHSPPSSSTEVDSISANKTRMSSMKRVRKKMKSK